VTRKANWKWAIPSEDEWYKAAYYHAATTSYYDYPTGSNTAPGRDLADASGNNANYRGTPFPIDSGKYTTRAGEFQNSRSPYGTFDQGGNVWEWNEAVMDASRGMRGGAFDYYFASHLLASDRNSYYPPGEDGDIGFRVARIPEPASIALLLSGAAAGLIWWIRRKQHP
jgi:formylglycine-generating enzyme required for sulfatase activity